jgi:hypothetical protein
MIRPLTWLFLTAALGGGPVPSLAQTQTPPTPRRLSITISFENRRASTGLDDAMSRAGFGDTRPEQCGSFFGCSPPTGFPKSLPPRDGFLLSARYRWTDGFGLAVSVAEQSSLGRTMGYQEGGYTTALDPRVGTLALTVFYETRHRLRVEAGPGLFRIWHDIAVQGLQAFEHRTDSRLGAVGGVGLEWPRNSRIFVDVSGQYRWVGDVSVGPWNVRADYGGETARFPGAKFSLNHAILAFGIGLRL